MAPSLLPSSVCWAAWACWLQLMLATAADVERETCPPMLCGNVSITTPFGIVPDQATTSSCGLVGFQVVCTNNAPYLGSFQGKYGFQILDIFYHNGSLIIADVHKLWDLNSSHDCHAPTNNSTTKLGYPFSISLLNQNLIFYRCTTTPAAGEALVETRCGNGTFVRAAESSDEPGSYGSYSLQGCDATVVPVLPRHGAANASRYLELISDGFLLTWQLPSFPPLPAPPPSSD
ncbi:hypothetical protein ACP4OV_021998 [Aristida adscensionis]